MEWNNETLNRLSEIFGSKSREIRNEMIGLFPDIDSEFKAYDVAWKEYLSSIGLKMGRLHGDWALGEPREPIGFTLKDRNNLTYMSSDRIRMIRIVNAWHERYIEMTEDFAIKVLTLGFLP